MKQLQIQCDDLTTLFQKLDNDGSGEITLDELCEGFTKMKTSMKGSDRAIAYFRKMFKEVDKDDSATLNLKEFEEIMGSPHTLKRLAAFGVPEKEVEVIFEELATNAPSGGVTADSLIASFLKVRQTGLGESRGLNYLRTVFLEADANRSNTLTREEVKTFLCKDEVRTRIEMLKLQVPDWLGIFDTLDTNGDDNLSWDELSQGVMQLWKQGIEQDLKNQSKTAMSRLSRQPTRSTVGHSSSQSILKKSVSEPFTSPRQASFVSSASTATPSPISRSQSTMSSTNFTSPSPDKALTNFTSPSPDKAIFSPTPVETLAEEP